MNSILPLIEKAKNFDKDSMEILLIKFEPIINSLTYKLGYDCAKTDLTIFFINLIHSIKLYKIINLSEGALVKYISTSLRRECYKLNKSILLNECEINDNISITLNEYVDVEYKILLDELVSNKVISQKQKYILVKKYYENFTDIEIAKALNISRQAISKTHRQAINNIKEYLN